eukprot:scaffold47795_cov68-Phaeocystis_antarctica.AAC.5
MQLLRSLLQPVPVARVDHEDDGLCVLIVVPPQRAQLLLPAHVPHGEGDVLVLERLDVEADGGDRLLGLAELESVEDARLARGVEADHEDAHLALGEHAVDDPPAELPHDALVLQAVPHAALVLLAVDHLGVRVDLGCRLAHRARAAVERLRRRLRLARVALAPHAARRALPHLAHPRARRARRLGLEPLAADELDRLLGDVLPRRLVAVDVLREGVSPLRDQREHLRVVVAVKGREAAEQDVEHDAQAPHVDGMVVGRALHLAPLVRRVPGEDLRRRIVGRAAQSHELAAGRADAGVAKVDELDG